MIFENHKFFINWVCRNPLRKLNPYRARSYEFIWLVLASEKKSNFNIFGFMNI